MNPLLAPLSSLDHHVFTTKEAASRGLTPFDLVRLVKAGELEHLARGVYAFPGAEGERAEQRHLRLAAGVCRLYPDAVLTHHSAVLALGLPVWGANLSKAHLARNVPAERIAQHWVIRPRPPWLEQVTGSVGSCASVAATTVHHALESGSVAGIVAADFALHEKRLTVPELEAMAAHVAGWPRSHHVTTMLAHMDGRSESPGESRLRVDLSMAGIDVVPQVTVTDAAGKFVAASRPAGPRHQCGDRVRRIGEISRPRIRSTRRREGAGGRASSSRLRRPSVRLVRLGQPWPDRATGTRGDGCFPRQR